MHVTITTDSRVEIDQNWRACDPLMAEKEESPAHSPPASRGNPVVPAPLFAGLQPIPYNNVSRGGRSLIRNSPSHESWLLDGSSPACASPLPPVASLARRMAAEFIGTFILVFAGTWVAIEDVQTGGAITILGLAATAGLTVTVLVLATGHISGAHLNPSITIAYAAFNHFPRMQAPAYIAAQMAGSLCAAFAVKGIGHPVMAGGVTVPSGGIKEAFVMELIITFILMFVITAVSTDTRAVKEFGAVAVGATIALNVLIAGKVSGASMNPARTLGPAVAAKNYKAIWVYFTAPILGTVAGAGVYTLVLKQTEVDNPEKFLTDRTLGK